MDNKHSKMMAFWSDRAKRFREDPRANTNDVWLRELEIEAVSKAVSSCQAKSVLDFGCANGYTTMRLSERHIECQFDGIDVNRDMINVALEHFTRPNVSYRQVNILESGIDKQYDMIYAVRVFQNIETENLQLQILDKLIKLIKSGGLFYCIESYRSGYEEINRDREAIGLPVLPLHPHLNLLDSGFDNHVAKCLEVLEVSYPTSSYYLATRLLYSKIAQLSHDDIDYNHPIHQVAAIIPQIGAYGPQKALLCRKR